MAIANLNTGRQWALIALQGVKGEELEAAVMVPTVNLPVDAIIVGGALIVVTAFDAGTTLDVGTFNGPSAGATIGVPADGTIEGRTEFVLDGTVNTIGANVALQSNQASVAGFAYMEVQYVRPNRANEVQE